MKFKGLYISRIIIRRFTRNQYKATIFELERQQRKKHALHWQVLKSEEHWIISKQQKKLLTQHLNKQVEQSLTKKGAKTSWNYPTRAFQHILFGWILKLGADEKESIKIISRKQIPLLNHYSFTNYLFFYLSLSGKFCWPSHYINQSNSILNLRFDCIVPVMFP